MVTSPKILFLKIGRNHLLESRKQDLVMGKNLQIHKAVEPAEYVIRWMSKGTACDVGEQLWANLHSESITQQHPDTAAERTAITAKLTVFQFELLSPEIHVVACAHFTARCQSLLSIIMVYEDVFEMFKQGVTIPLE